MAHYFGRGICNRVLGRFCSKKKTTTPESWHLIPLTPEYLSEEHRGYVGAIETALVDEQIRNIALSGNYGVGKSSILHEVARRQKGRIVELSLSTLAPIEASKFDDSIPVQATTSTNRIQQEIVKQLLYREYPRKYSGSRFRRIERFQCWRAIGVSLLLGFFVAVTSLLTGWSLQISSELTPYVNAGVWIHPAIWGVAALIVLLVSRLFYGRLNIRQLSAGAATVTLNDSSVSYFDQYLDEIVYFFEVSGNNIVIFEDIDRFNDSHIFETLRALNTLLNVSPQIKKPIRFIYAIKDSIFDHIGLEKEERECETGMPEKDDPVQAEMMRANRTKFFDLIIPVVPFITHRSARNLAVQLLDGTECKVAPELLDVAAQYAPDMRLLKNVRNEFLIFRNRIFSGDGEQLDLKETDLFAMMLYKSTHLTDFEAIRHGTSRLDILYQISRELVTENIKRAEGERGVFRQRLAQIDGAATRSSHLGELLLAHIERTARSAPVLGFRRQNGVTYSADGTSKSDDDLKSVEFWTAFVSADGDPDLHQQMSRGQALTFSRSSLVEALGDPLDAESWSEEDSETLNEQIDEKKENIKFLRSADLGDLVKRPEFLVEYKGSKQTFEEVAKDLLKSELAYQLIRAGHLNRNFTLYTSTFHGGRVPPAAMNFIIHHAERDIMDEYFELAPADVDAVVRELGTDALEKSSLYNIAILDHLLAINSNYAGLLIKSLTSLGENQERFLLAYLRAGDQRKKFIGRLTVVFSRVLAYLVNHADLDDISRLELVNIALEHLPSPRQQIDSVVSRYLLVHYAELTTLTSDAITFEQAERISALFASSSIIIPYLDSLSEPARSSFVSRSLYEITHKNLTIAIGGIATVALDVIRAVNETMYEYVLRHLSEYVDAINGASTTIDANNHFISVIEDVLEHDASRIGDVIEFADYNCKIKDLADVSEGAWPALGAHLRFPATFSNISSYVSKLGSVDVGLAKVLIAAGEIIELDVADEEAKAALAIKLLAARDQIPSTALRAKLVADLNLQDCICVKNLDEEKGDFFALLLKHSIIADDAISYEYLASCDWATRKGFIQNSENFKDYITPEMMQSDLAMLLTSDEIDSAIKDVVVDQAEAYAEVANFDGLSELARYATQYSHKLSFDVVQKMAQEDVGAQEVILLLEPHLPSINRDDLFTTLKALDGDYPKLTEVGRTILRVPNTLADRALLERLKQEDIVSTYDEHESQIRVNRKRK